MPAKKLNESKILTDIIVNGIQEIKGKEIKSLNLMNIPNAVSNYFVVCHGTSKIQVEAIAESVEKVVRINTGQKPWNKEGFENAEWILLDYVDVVVHIFQEERRTFYNIENLWADAKIVEYESE